MMDATRILDMLVGGGANQGTSEPSAPSRQAAASGDLIARARGMLDSAGGGLAGGLGGGVAAGAITSLLLGSRAGREFAGEALKLGAAAALGGLAYRAYSNYRTGQPVGADTASASVPSVKPMPLPAVTPANEHALLLVRAMIAAALSDGVLDENERSNVMGRLAAAGIGADEQRCLAEELAHPLSPTQLAAAARTAEQRAEVYLASALAIDADTDAERAYLRYLAAALGLDDGLIAHLTDAVAQARSIAPAAAVGLSPPTHQRAFG